MELLRIVAMLLVLVVHADFVALGIPSLDEIAESPVGSFMRFFVESISIVCVNLFVLISGWFGIRFKLLRLSEFLFQILFFCIIMSGFFVLFGVRANDFDLKDFVKYFTCNYWFVWSYIILYLFAPALNLFVENEQKKNLKWFLVLFFFVQTVFDFKTGLGWFSKGYSPLFFMGLYVLGRYMHLYPNKLTARKGIIYLFMYFSMGIIATCLAYLLSGKMGYSYIYSYSSPIIIAESVFLFLFFTKFSLKNSIINWGSVSCFSVYLVHCFPFL